MPAHTRRTILKQIAFFSAAGTIKPAFAAPPDTEPTTTVSVKHFGAEGNGVSDDTRAIQSAIEYCDAATNSPILRLPAGTYRITDSLYFGKPSSPTRRTTFNIVGDGRRHFPVLRPDDTNVTAGTMIDATALTDRPALVVQGNFASTFKGFSILGSGYQNNYDGAYRFADDVSAWIPTNHTSGRYNPSCGVAIDPYSGPAPLFGGYGTGISYGRAESNNIRFDDVNVFGFVVGFGISINTLGHLGAEIRFFNCQANTNAYGFVACGSQNRDIQFDSCSVGYAHTGFDTRTFGAQSGDLGHIRGGLGGYCWRLFNVRPNSMNNSCLNFYAESIRRIGDCGVLERLISSGFQFRECFFKEETDTPWDKKHPLFFPQGGGVSCDGVMFWSQTPYANLHGIGGDGVLAPSRFVNCSFILSSQKGAPIPHPMHRWYIGETSVISRARPRFVDCKTNMFTGDRTLAKSWLGSSDSASETIYINSSELPVRKEVVNYSSSRLIDFNGKAYNLKNISTYSPVEWPVKNSRWLDSEFSFDAAAVDEFALNDIVLYGRSSLPLKIVGIQDSKVRCLSLFDARYYDRSAGFHNDPRFRVIILNAQFVNSGAIVGDVVKDSFAIGNIKSATTAFKAGDFIGTHTEEMAFPPNTRVGRVEITTVICNKRALATKTGAVIGNLICLPAA